MSLDGFRDSRMKLWGIMAGTSGWPSKQKVLANCDIYMCKGGDECLYCQCATWDVWCVLVREPFCAKGVCGILGRAVTRY